MDTIAKEVSRCDRQDLYLHQELPDAGHFIFK